MSINLSKGQKINLSKETGSLSKLMVGIGWEVDESKASLSRSGKVMSIDCDAFAVILGADGKAIGSKYNDCTVYFNNLNYGNGAVIHMGDNRSGHSDYNIPGDDDEQIIIDLSLVPAEVSGIVFALNIYDAVTKKQDFGMLKNSYIRIIDTVQGKEICKYVPDSTFAGATALVAGRILKHGNEWEFVSEGSAYSVENIFNIVSMFKQ